MIGLRGAVVVTGTDTGVGKTIVTAAIAAAAGAHDVRVAVVKPAQTGIPSGSAESSDVEIVLRLAAPRTARTLSTYPDALAPFTAARVAGLAPLDRDTVAAAARQLATTHDLVLIEGAGGLLVPMGPAPEPSPRAWTVADLAVALRAPTVVVVRAGLGTLNHTALTLDALERRGLDPFVVIGAWPTDPELVHRSNLADLSDLADGLAGVLPAGAGALTRATFIASAPSWLAPALHGRFDPSLWSQATPS